MQVLVTGADGFVGRSMLRRLLGEGHRVHGAVRPGAGDVVGLTAAERAAVEWVPLELEDTASVRAAVASRPEAVIHLAAVASSADARRDVGGAWAINAAGTARLAEELARLREAGVADPLLLLASSGEVYGSGPARPRTEADPLLPCSPYAASKVGAEAATLEVWRRTGLRVVIARAFPHTGPGQSTRFVAPAFAERLRLAKRAGAPVVKTGNLEPVRDFLDVRDVTAAYLALVHRGTPGEAYNVARGEGIALAELFERLARLVGIRAIPELDPGLVRPADIFHLVGDPTRLRAATGWNPTIDLDVTLKELVDAQAD
jgi:GDP-4-dehydro-6-deoxy-D-mannose reductase